MLKFFNLKLIFKYSFILFIVSALYGLFIRFNYAFPQVSFNYQSFLQGHSHVAFLGWGYLATIGLILHFFVPKELRNNNKYKILFSILVISILLMLISFPLSGYNLFSIALLSTFGIVSYFLTFGILKDLDNNKAGSNFIKYGLYYYLLSSLATWFLAYVIVTQGKTDLYYNTVYFYLHFLYNGFFVFSLLGLLFNIFSQQRIKNSLNLEQKVFIFLNIACIPTYFLSVLWSTEIRFYYVAAFFGAFSQLVALFYFIKLYNQFYKQLKWNWLTKLLLQFALISFFIKIVLQFLSSFPYFVKLTLALKPYFIIGYLHLFTLGFMSVLLLLFLVQSTIFKIESKVSKSGVLLILLGIFFTEFLMFGQGFSLLIKVGMLPYYNIVLFVCSVVIVSGLLFFFGSQFKEKQLDK